MSLARPLRSGVRSVIIAIIAFTLGSASVVFAASTGAMQLPVFRLADGVDPDRVATVDANGDLHVSVSNQPSTQQISGTVSVSNFPSTQTVNGTVSVSSGRTILVATDLSAHPNAWTITNNVDTSDCRSLVGIVDHSDVSLQLAMITPSGGFGTANGTSLGLVTYFTVGGTNVVAPRSALFAKSDTDDTVTVPHVWIFCGH